MRRFWFWSTSATASAPSGATSYRRVTGNASAADLATLQEATAVDLMRAGGPQNLVSDRYFMYKTAPA